MSRPGYVLARWFLVLLALDGMSTVAAAQMAGPDEPADKRPDPQSGKQLVYFGTYTRGQSKGIYVSRFDYATGTLEPVTLAAEVANPSFLAIHPTRPLLYAVSELPKSAGKNTGGVSVFTMDSKTGQLTLLNQESSAGAGPCHLAVHPSGNYVMTANYGSGAVGCLPILPDGRLGAPVCRAQHVGSSVNPKRQQGPHAHWVGMDKAGRFAFVADLGLDKVLAYRFDASSGNFSANDPAGVAVPPGAGPRHVDFHPNGRWAYVINEIDSTMTALAYDSQRGAFTVVQTVSTLPQGFSGVSSTAEVQVHPSGKFLYGSNRGHDSIAIFTIDESTGKIQLVGHEPTQGKAPRHFLVDPTGKYLLAANQDTSNVLVLRIDAAGKLEPVGSPLSVPIPVCVLMPPCRGR